MQRPDGCDSASVYSAEGNVPLLLCYDLSYEVIINTFSFFFLTTNIILYMARLSFVHINHNAKLKPIIIYLLRCVLSYFKCVLSNEYNKLKVQVLKYPNPLYSTMTPCIHL